MMLVNQTAEYALRAVAYLAYLPADERAPAADLAAAASIPKSYLSKVMRRLVVADICTAQRGHYGGFALARAPSDISFMEVLIAADYDPTPSRCVFGLAVCDSEHPCPLHNAWSEMKQAFIAWAEHTTLADVTPPTERSE